MKRTRLRNYLRDRRGAAAVEFALGTVVMVSASLLALDLYRLAGMQTTTTHVAVSLADTVSRKEPPGLTKAELLRKMSDFVESLSELLHEEQFPTSNARFAVAAVYKYPGPPAASLTTLWSTAVVRRPPSSTSPLTSCKPANQTNEIQLETNPVTLPAGFTLADMADRETVIVAEVCVERTNTAFPGPAYAHYIVPSRDDNLASRLSAP